MLKACHKQFTDTNSENHCISSYMYMYYWEKKVQVQKLVLGKWLILYAYNITIQTKSFTSSQFMYKQ